MATQSQRAAAPTACGSANSLSGRAVQVSRRVANLQDVPCTMPARHPIDMQPAVPHSRRCRRPRREWGEEGTDLPVNDSAFVNATQMLPRTPRDVCLSNVLGCANQVMEVDQPLSQHGGMSRRN